MTEEIELALGNLRKMTDGGLLNNLKHCIALRGRPVGFSKPYRSYLLINRSLPYPFGSKPVLPSGIVHGSTSSNIRNCTEP